MKTTRGWLQLAATAIRRFSCVAVVPLAVVLGLRASAQCIIEENQPIIGADTNAGDMFGSSVAISGDLAIVGAPFDATERGSVYVFRLENGLWVQEQKLMALDPDTFGHFGASVDIDGDTLIVGAPDNDFFVGRVFVEDAGEADVFRRVSPGKWVHEATLQASNAEENAEFGNSVAISGHRVIIGAHAASGAGSTGAAYVFERQGTVWNETAKLIPSDAPEVGNYAFSVSISGNTAVVSSHFDDNGAGAAYVYTVQDTRWLLEQKITTPGAPGSVQFARDVAIDGDLLIAGHFDDDELAPDAGAAYVFHRRKGQWIQEAKLLSLQASPNEAFGETVAIDGDVALIAGGLLFGTSIGQASLFRRSGDQWIEIAWYTPSDIESNVTFGFSADLDAGVALLGDQNHSAAGFHAGKAYVFPSEFQQPDLNCDGQVDGNDLGELLLDWRACARGRSCNADFDGNSGVDGADLGFLLLSWTG